MKRLFLVLLGLFIVGVDLYLAKKVLFPDKENKKVIVLPEEKSITPPSNAEEKAEEEQKAVDKENKTIKEKTPAEPVKKPQPPVKKTVNKEVKAKTKRLSEKEIDQLIQQIIEEAKLEYNYNKKKEEKKNILEKLEKLLNFGH
ncbi:hypothetical protein [Persephonella sp.]